MPGILGDVRDLAYIEPWAKKEGVWAKSAFCGQKAKFAGQKKFIAVGPLAGLAHRPSESLPPAVGRSQIIPITLPAGSACQIRSWIMILPSYPGPSWSWGQWEVSETISGLGSSRGLSVRRSIGGGGVTPRNWGLSVIVCIMQRIVQMITERSVSNLSMAKWPRSECCFEVKHCHRWQASIYWEALCPSICLS